MIKLCRKVGIALVLLFGSSGFSQAATQETAAGIYKFTPDGGDVHHAMLLVTDVGSASFETVNSEHAGALLDET